MRSPLTMLVVAGLIGLGVAAAVDALRDEDNRRSVRRPTAPGGEVADALAAAGIRGVITYSNDRCRLHAVRLPSLATAPAPSIRSCEPHIPTGGIGTWKGDVVWSGFGFGTVQTVLSKQTINKAVTRKLGIGGLGLRAHQAASLAGQRHAVLLEGEAGDRYLTFFEGVRLLSAYSLPEVGEEDVLRPSPRGRRVALLTPGQAGVRLFTHTGARVDVRTAASSHAIAWSPDERWTALATRRGLIVFASARPNGSRFRIPVAVRDLDWGA